MRRFLLLPIIFLFFALTGWLYFGINLKTTPDAFATGGAFPSTKHGGGTVDGIKFPGINRATGGDVASYFGDNPEAGDYQPGECAHCHEPHASFGGNEPPPNSILYNSEMSSTEAAGPDPYLLFGAFDSGAAQGTYSKLCWYCHEKMSLGIPPNPPGYGYWGFYQGKTKYTASIHYNSPNFYWTGTTGDPVSIWPRQNRSALPSGNKGSCLNCHTPHGIKESSTAGQQFDTTAVPTTPTNKHLAANNADVSTDYLIPRQLIAWEEALCLNCHKSGGVGPDINTQLSRTTKHPVIDTALAGRHKTKEYLNVSNTGQLDGKYWNSAKTGTDTRHVECVDCHNPHVAQAIASDKNRTGMTQVQRSAEMVRLRGPLLGQWGAVPRNNGNTANHIGVYASMPANYFTNNWPAAAAAGWPEPTTGNVTNYIKAYFNDTTSSDMYEAYLCLKCHSYFAWGTDGVQSVTTGSGTYAQTDVTRDFNPNNLGYHPVFNHGQNRPGANNTNFNLAFNNARGIYQDSYITCTDCHNSSDTAAADARGPHGSANSFILRSNETGVGTAVVFCYNCHMRDTYSDNANKCNGNTGSGGSCLYSRQTHPPDKENGNVWTRPPNSPMPGIWCMDCHGGGRFGGLHGSNEPVAYGTTPRGYRLVNGATWSGWEAGTTSAPVKCWSTSGAGVIAGYTNYSFCTRSLNGDTGMNANYNYPPAHSDP